jgi:protein-tyrosine-phosphatase
MSKPRIVTVCKYNQARSITSAAILRRFFPDHEVLSAGIQADPFQPIPSSILQILDEWEITEFDERSTKVVDLPPLLKTDLVLCADAEVRSKLIEQLRIDDIEDYSIRILDEFSNSSLEIPVDPVSMDESDTKTQLARAIILSIRAVRREFSFKQPITKSSFPVDRIEHLKSQKMLLEAIQQNQGVIIDSGFSIPNELLWQVNGTTFEQINPNRLEIAANNQIGNRVLISKYEIDRTSRILLSIKYLQWLEELAARQSTYLLAQPQSELPRARHHEAILSLIHS